MVFGAGGVLAAALVLMVVVLAPRQSSGPIAVSASTAPVRTITVSAAPPAATDDPSGTRLVSLTRIPAAVSSMTPARAGTHPAARTLPDPDAAVVVVTDDMTYRLAWAALPWLQMTDGALVFDADGHLIGRVRGDRLVIALDAAGD